VKVPLYLIIDEEWNIAFVGTVRENLGVWEAAMREVVRS